MRVIQEPQTPAHTLPPFLKPLPGHPRISPVDLEYWTKKGALTLPSPKLEKAILRAYMEYFHPFMPLLGLHDFLTAVSNKHMALGNGLSLLLYQAVMFAGVTFVDEGLLREYGWKSTRDARRDFYTKVKVSRHRVLSRRRRC